MRKVARYPKAKVDVDFNIVGEHAGRGSITLSSFLGPLVREYVPLVLPSWKKVEERTKDILWEEIQERFNLQEDWQRHSIFKQMGCLWRSSKSRLVRKVRAAKSSSERLKLKPGNIQSVATWNNWVKTKISKEFKVTSDKFRDLRMSQIPHTTSRKGMYRLSEEMKKKSSDSSKVTRSKVWIAGHTHSNGTPVRPEFVETIEQIQSLDSQLDSTANDSIREDAVSQVLGKDRKGRIRGMGRGATYTKLAFVQARDSHVQKLEASQATLEGKYRELEEKVRDLTGQKKMYDDVGSQSPLLDVRKGGVRCQLLDWIATDEIIVAEGEFCSADPMYKIGSILLGPNASAVIVTSALNPATFIWRPTPDMSSLEQAVGVKIAWPSHKVILDTNQGSISGEQERSKDESLDRCEIYDWTEEELVAEGVVCSTEPTEMVNDVQLGPNAAIVKVKVVFKHEAYLWRPRPEVYLLGDALNTKIAWPIHKVNRFTSTAREESVRRSTMSQSASASNSSSKSITKRKCILLDCKDSSKIVAEGKVYSSNPSDVVHFVPLGPGASKVWVEVCKIGSASVWRPNSEIQSISDAIGTTVAWPNEKLILL